MSARFAVAGLLLLAGSGARARGDAERSIQPFYAFSWNETLSNPSVAGLILGSHFGSTLGGKYTLNDRHAVFGVYDLQYRGPGLQSQEGRLFSERTIDHNLFLEHQWSAVEDHTFKTRLIYMRELRRAAASEVFGNGLYDFDVYGFSLADEFEFNRRFVFGLGITYRSFTFPNYTDLLHEFQTGAVGTEVSGSQQDYGNIRVEAFTKVSRYGKAWIAYSNQAFKHARVVEASGALSGEKQKDTNVELGAGGVYVIPRPWESMPGRLIVTPALRLNFKSSNQNFLRFKFFGDTNPDFIENNYAYTYLKLGSPLSWSFKNGWRIFFAPSWEQYGYADRPPRNSDGVYLTGSTQRNSTFLLSLGFSKPVGKFAHWTLGWAYHRQWSNTKFERFVPYNYSGNIFYSSFDILY